MLASKKVKLLDFKFKKNLGSNLFGVYKTAFIGTGIEFSEIREYEYGENIKSIDWKTTAKKSELYIKKFEEERDVNVIFALDISQTMNFGSQNTTKKDMLQEICYALGYSAIENNDNVGAMLYDENIQCFIPPQKGYSSLYKIIEKSQEVGTQKKDTKKLLRELVKRQIKKSLIFIMTDDMNIGEEKFLKILSKENHIIMIHIFDRVENYLFEAQNDITLGTSSAFMSLNLSDTKKKNEYIHLREEKRNDLKHLLQKNNIGYLYIDNTLNMYSELTQYFYKIS